VIDRTMMRLRLISLKICW